MVLPDGDSISSLYPDLVLLGDTNTPHIWISHEYTGFKGTVILCEICIEVTKLRSTLCTLNFNMQGTAGCLPIQIGFKNQTKFNLKDK